MGTATASSASATRSGGSPHASLPNIHAVGSSSRARTSGSSRPRPARPSAATIRNPAARIAAIASPSLAPATTGRWNRLPAEARTHFPLYGSTDASANTTACAPAASAVRSTVPAFPGSRTLASSTASRGTGETASASGTSMKPQTASRPCGVTVWASSLITSPLTTCTGTPAAATAVTRSWCRLCAGTVTNRSLIRAPLLIASATACGPSARNARSRSRKVRLVSRRAALTGPGGATPLGSRGSRCVGKGLLGHFDQGGEGRLVRDRELGEHPPVDLDSRYPQALDEPVVGHAVGPGRGVDPLDPQPAERALAVLAVAVGIGHRVEQLLLGLAVQAGPLSPVAAGPLQDNLALLVGVSRPLHACHCSDSLRGPGYLPSSFLI